MSDYKDDIINTRKGYLGGSDAKMLAQIASLGSVPNSAKLRLAVCKGLVEPSNISTRAMQWGDAIENAIFAHLAMNDERWESNPRWESMKHRYKNVTLICHPDFVFKDEEKKVLRIYECKCTKFGVNETRQTYKAQMYVETAIAKELAASLGKQWRVRTYLVHYCTDGVDIHEDIEFDPERLTVSEVRFKTPVFDIARAMRIVDDYLSTMEDYYEAEEVDAQLLPATVQGQFSEIATFLREIKEREEKINAFKEKLLAFMTDKGIKKVWCDDFSFTVVAASMSSSVDYKRIFNEEIASKHPVKAAKLERKYQKVSSRKAYINIKVKDKEQ